MYQHRHYTHIAETIAELGAHNVPGLTAEQHAAIVEHFTRAMRGTNPNFSADRFAACAAGKPINGRDRSR